MATTNLDKLTLKREQLNAKIQAIKSKEASQEHLTQILDKHLEKDADRALFELPERVKNEQKRETLEQELIGA